MEINDGAKNLFADKNYIIQLKEITSNILVYLFGTLSHVPFILCTAEWSRPLEK